jgi:hypothetical protein
MADTTTTTATMTTRNSYYAAWNRTLRLQTPPYLARVGTNTSRRATELHLATTRDGTGADIPLGDPAAAPTTPGAGAGAGANTTGGGEGRDKKKKEESLFGPHIGQVAPGPEWTEREVSEDSPSKELEGGGEKLTPEIVQGWIAKSKETSRPTTTLQALVNLKRPSIRLTPIAVDATDGGGGGGGGEDQGAHHLHGLEFEFDCDAPKCHITTHVLLPPDHPDAAQPESRTSTSSAPTPGGLARVKVFDAVKDGGFGQVLKLNAGAALELGRFEVNPHVVSTSSSSPTHGGEGVADASNEAAAQGKERRRPSKAFSQLLARRRQSHAHAVTGPALAVVDASEPTPSPEAKHLPDSGEEGVKVLIRLSALDKEGSPLPARNEQITYLHVVRFGARPSKEEEKDGRGWVVKVVKREAVIGRHTFHLHEIFGLSARGAGPSAPIAPTLDETQAPQHAYPPPPTTTVPGGAAAAAAAAAAPEDDSTSECLLCLSSPREVVLLPCRHLVACKPCALNMIEFGAGGTVQQPTEVDAAPGADGAGAGGAGEGGGGGAAGGGVTAAPTRRKRKAKGWFCPVCRQRRSLLPPLPFPFILSTMLIEWRMRSIHIPPPHNHHPTHQGSRS